MTKYLVLIVIVLLSLNIYALNYLNDLYDNQIPFEYELDKDKLIYQIRDIHLNSIDEFIFDNYFKILSLKDKSYRYEFDDEYIYIDLNGNNYQYKYYINEPTVITKTIYVENTNSDSNISNKQISSDIQTYIQEDIFYVDSEVLVFDVGTSFEDIKEKIMQNIHTSYQTSIDYTSLNPSYIDDYEVIYSCENKNISIIVKIV